MKLNDRQEAVSIGLSTASAILSLIGAVLVCCHVIFVKKFKRSYDRLLFGISCADLIMAVRLIVFAPFLYPLDTPSQECTINGFLLFMGYSASYYNCALAFYFFLTIYCGKREREILRFEPFLHSACLLFILIPSTTALFLQYYNPSPFSLGCWVNEYPYGCADDPTIECKRGEAAPFFAYVTIVVPLLVLLVLLISFNVAIFWTVRKTETASERWSFHSAANQASPKPTAPRLSLVTIKRLISRPPNDSPRSSKQPKTKSQQIAKQSLFFVSALFCCYIWSFLRTVISSVHPEGIQSGNYFWLLALESFFFPLQGKFDKNQITINARQEAMIHNLYLLSSSPFQERQTSWSI